MWRIFAFFGCIFFSLSCGLEVYHVLEAPISRINLNNTASNNDSQQNYYSFRTNDSRNHDQGDFSYSGTEIYYKIYMNPSTLNSDTSSISALNTSSSSNTGAAAERIINTLKYQKLRVYPTEKGTDTFIEKGDSDRIVEIRLTLDNTFFPYIKIGDLYLGKNSNYKVNSDNSWTDTDGNQKSEIEVHNDLLIPLRNVSGDKTFDFFDKADKEKENGTPKYGKDAFPQDDDEDFSGKNSADIDAFYVKMFAFASGFDYSTYSQSYSRVLDLGEYCIKK